MNKPILAGTQYPLPPADNGERICVTLKIPSDATSIGNFVGALYTLARWNNYLPDPSGARRNKPTADIWRDIITAMRFTICPDGITHEPIEESEYEMSLCEQLRWQDGKLQALCCGEWTDIPGQPAPVGGSGQPGGGGTPDPGQCLSYHGNFEAKNQWYCPAIVNAGDTITFTNISGAGQDGTSAITSWRCPDGTLFFAGTCGASPGYHASGDPSATAFHMQLIAQINSTFYPITEGGVITIPSGVVNAPILVQANDANIADNLGSYAFDVEVCNNAAATFSHTFDFTLSDGGWIPDVTTTPWTPGTGWVLTVNGSIPQASPYIDFSTRTLTSIAFYYTAKSGSYNDNTIRAGIGGGTAVKSNALADPSPTTWLGSQSSNEVNFLFTHSGSSTGTVTLTKCVVTGIGTDPFLP